MWLLVNRLRPDMVKRGDMLALDDTLDILGIELIGVVPEDERIIRSSNVGEPIVLDRQGPGGPGLSQRHTAHSRR